LENANQINSKNCAVEPIKIKKTLLLPGTKGLLRGTTLLAFPSKRKAALVSDNVLYSLPAVLLRFTVPNP
jgi:hypothetical protein